jgi:hypothetical protein
MVTVFAVIMRRMQRLEQGIDTRAVKADAEEKREP